MIKLPRRVITDKGLSRHLGDNSINVEIYGPPAPGKLVNLGYGHGAVVKVMNNFYIIPNQNESDFFPVKAFRLIKNSTKVSIPLGWTPQGIRYRDYTYV